MANTTEEIMLTLGMTDNASRVAESAASNIQSTFSKLNGAMMNLGQVSDNVMQSLTGKSAMDNIFAVASKAETNNVLLTNMLDDAEKNFDAFYKKVDETTDKSIVSMQELIPALKAFKSATGATDEEMTNVTESIANFGAAVLAQTGSTDMAQQAMMDLSKGVKGAFASLDQYGISEDALKRTGYWNGDEKDVEGFMQAVDKVTGSTEALMQTNQGLDALIGKSFSRAGKKIGNEFLPIIKDIKRGFIDLDDSTGGAIASLMLLGSAGVEAGNRIMWNISTAVQGAHDLGDAFKYVMQKIKGVTAAAEEAGDAINTMSNISDIGAGAAGAGSAAGAGAEAVKSASKTEKAVDAGMDSVMIADMLKGNKNAQKEAEELLKELGYTEKLGDNVKKYSSQVYDPKKWSSYEEYMKLRDMGMSETGGGLKTAIDRTKDSRKDAGTLLKELSASKSEIDLIQNELDTIQTPKSSFQKMSDWFKGIFKGADEVADVIDEADDIADTLKGADAIGDGMKAAGAVGDVAATAGPAMDAGAAGGAAAAAGATSLSAAFTSMIVPALALAAVIAIMIPIAALIAAEAMIVIRLLAELMEALNFDSINLDGAVKGISSVATALAWVGVAMLALTAVNIATQLAMVTSFFLGLTGPLEAATDALLKAAGLLKQFSSVGIDPSVPTNLKAIGDSLMAVSSAMTALTWNNIVTGFSDWIAGALGFGSVTEGLSQAKDDIIKASGMLNEFSGITPLDDNVAKNIQNVCDSLASVGDAMGALRSIRDGQNWDDIFGQLMNGLFGEGVDIQTALLNVKDDIIQASQALAQFTGISEIPEDISTKIQKVGSTLSTVNDTVNTIKDIVGSGFDNWVDGLFGGYDVAGGLEKIKTDLITASQKLAGLSELSEVNEDVTTKIQQVGDALTKVSEVSGTLVNIGSSGIGEFDSTLITTAVTNVQTAATELAKLNEITFDGAAADTILGAIQTTLENVKTTLAAASGFSEPATNIGTQIVAGVRTGLSPLTSTIQGSVSSATGAAASTGWTGGSRIGTSTTNGFKSALKLADVMTTEMAHVKTAVDNGIAAAKAAAESGAQEVVAAFKSGINVGSPGDIARAMKQELIYTKDFILAAYTPLKEAAYSLGQNIVNGFGNPSLNMDMFSNGGQLTAEYVGALKTTISRSPDKTDNRPVTIIVSENAVNVDARNYTTKEAQGLMITAFEGLNSVKNIDVDI